MVQWSFHGQVCGGMCGGSGFSRFFRGQSSGSWSCVGAS